MSLPPDYHMHTPLCHHARGEPTEYAAKAVELGLKEIGFSDHSPMPRDDFDDWRMAQADLRVYVEKVEKARREHPQLIIYLALEVDFLPGLEGWIQELSQREPWDYLIGAVHYLGDHWAIDNPHQMSEWKKRDPLQVWTDYFERLTQAAATGFFDIIAHADLPKKFGIYPTGDCTESYKKFLTAAKRTDTAIELNTAGLRKDCKEIYPSQALLKLAREIDVPITFGSDAHAPQEVGANFREAVDWARRAGYERSRQFRQGEWQSVDLPR